MIESSEQLIAKLTKVRKELEAAGHRFDGFPMKCTKCRTLIGILVELPITPCLCNLPNGR